MRFFIAIMASVRFFRTTSLWRSIGVLVAVGLAVLVFALTRSTPTLEAPLPRGVTPAEYQRAREAFELATGRRSDRLDVLYWLADRNLASNRPVEAIACLAEIPTEHLEYGRMARYQQGRTLLRMHRAVEAEPPLRELITAEEVAPRIETRYLIDARQNLRHILEVELRFEERHQLLRGVIERGEEDPFEAVAGCFPSLLRWNGPQASEWLEQFHESGPASPWLEIALGRYRTGQGRPQEARRILEAVVRQDPGNLRAVAALVACLRECDDLEGARRRMDDLPARSSSDPWWLLIQRGWFLSQDGKGEQAAAAYEQLLQQDRTSSEAWQGLAEAARLLNDPPRRTKALRMAATLGRIQNHLGKAIQDASNPESFLDVADLCAEIPLIREGAIMTRCALRMTPDNERVRKTAELFRKLLDAEQLPPLLGH